MLNDYGNEANISFFSFFFLPLENVNKEVLLVKAAIAAFGEVHWASCGLQATRQNVYEKQKRTKLIV